MKTPEEIKKGLECCVNGYKCVKCCPYNRAKITKCTSDLSRDALAYIRQLEAQLVNQATEYGQALKITTEQRDTLLGTQDKLAALLSYVTGGRFSKTSYSIDEMERFVDDYQQSECAKCDELERVKVERDVPTVDAAPVVHGRWIDSKGAIRCSECMNEPLYDYHGRLKLSMACPTCGAKMWKEK